MYPQYFLLYILLLLIGSGGISTGAPHNRATGGVISGVVIDPALNAPVEYANVVLSRVKNAAPVAGTTTDRNGFFQLPGLAAGMYRIEVHFVGYQVYTLDKINIQSAATQIDLGKILLRQQAIAAEEVEIVAEKPAIEYQIDRKVINVDKHYTGAAGTAVDILENVPSVSVDIEGNVSLRGSGSFTVQIDGKPTILDASEALQQIPASSIDNIEILTNPSAKYEPDGAAGIINIITKKSKLQGLSGLIDMNIGSEKRYGYDLTLNYRTEKYSAAFSADYNQRNAPGSDDIVNQTLNSDTISAINASGGSNRSRNPYGFRGAIDFFPGEGDVIGIGARYSSRDGTNHSELEYDEWQEPGDAHHFYRSLNTRERSRQSYYLDMDYRHKFAGKNHQFSARISLRGRDGEEISTNELRETNGDLTSGQQSTEAGPSNRLRVRLDYTRPVGAKGRFESGYQSRFRYSKDLSNRFDYNPLTGRYELLPQYSSATEYTRDTHALYALYSGEKGRFGFQGGLRGEYTLRDISQVLTQVQFGLNRWDYFPTLHLSYQHPGRQQVMASYTRRIDHPGSSQLEPFETWRDAYNVRRGNPALEPEFIDSYELGFQSYFGANLLSVEGYYRVTHNKIERVRSVYADNIMLHTYENVGTDYAFGSEFTLSVEQLKWWQLNLLGNIYHYRIEGALADELFNEESFNWSARLNNTFRVGKSTRLQFNGNYNSATVTAQGRREGYFRSDAALRQDFMNRKISAIFQVRDIFGSGSYEYTSSGADFYSYRFSTVETPQFMLTLRYNFNNFKDKKPSISEGEVPGGAEEE